MWRDGLHLVDQGMRWLIKLGVIGPLAWWCLVGLGYIGRLRDGESGFTDYVHHVLFEGNDLIWRDPAALAMQVKITIAVMAGLPILCVVVLLKRRKAHHKYEGSAD
jgi:hypothetical protein